jgi:hypothetical protein
MRPALTRLLREVVGDVQAMLRRERAGASRRGPAVHPARVAALGSVAELGREDPRLEPRRRRSRQSHVARLAAAERELRSVHLAELAFGLRQAARLRRRLTADSGHPVEPEAERSCRAGLSEALDCARSDGLTLARPLRELAGACVDLPLAAWPTASGLARTALDLEPGEVGRTELAQALLAEGDVSAASRLLACALLSCPSARRGAGLLEQLARIESLRGRARRARALRSWAARTQEVA